MLTKLYYFKITENNRGTHEDWIMVHMF